MEKLEEFVDEPFRSHILLIESILKIDESNFNKIFESVLKEGVWTKYIFNSIKYIVKTYVYRNPLIIEFLECLGKKLNIKMEKIKKNPYKPSSIEEAIFNDDVERFIKFASEPDFRDYLPYQYKTPTSNASLFPHKYMELIAFHGSLKCFKYALMDGSFNYYNCDKFAIAGGNIEIIHLLEQNGVEFNKCLGVACSLHRNNIVEWLLNNYQNMYIGLNDCTESGNLRALFYFLHNKTVEFSNVVSLNGVALKYDIIDLSKWALKYCKDKEELTDEFNLMISYALTYAVKSGLIEFVKFLVEEMGASVFTETSNLNTTNRRCFSESILIFAIRMKNIEIVKYLIFHGGNKEFPGELGEGTHTLLNAAVFFGTKEIAELVYQTCYIENQCEYAIMPPKDEVNLIDKFNHSSFINGEHFSILKLAISRGELDMVKLVVEKFHKNVTDEDIKYARGRNDIQNYLNKIKQIHRFVACEDFHQLRMQYEEDPNILKSYFDGQTILHIAVSKGNFNITKFICEKFKEMLKYKNIKNAIPAIIALEKNNFNIFKLMMEIDDSIADISYEANSLLNVAIAFGNLEVVKYMVNNFPTHLSNENDIQEETYLCYAIALNKHDIVKYLIEEAKIQAGVAEINTTIDTGDFEMIKYFAEDLHLDIKQATPEYFPRIATNGDFEGTRYLIEKYGFDPNAVSFEDETCLTAAIQYNNIEFVKYLVEKCKVNLSTVCDMQRTYLHFVAANNCVEIGKYLISKYNFDVNAKDGDGKTAFDIALESGDLRLVKFIVEDCHFDINAENGNQILLSAIEKNLPLIVEYLVSKCGVIITGEHKSEAKYCIDKRIYEFIKHGTPIYKKLGKDTIDDNEAVFMEKNSLKNEGELIDTF